MQKVNINQNTSKNSSNTLDNGSSTTNKVESFFNAAFGSDCKSGFMLDILQYWHFPKISLVSKRFKIANNFQVVLVS